MKTTSRINYQLNKSEAHTDDNWYVISNLLIDKELFFDEKKQMIADYLQIIDVILEVIEND